MAQDTTTSSGTPLFLFLLPFFFALHGYVDYYDIIFLTDTLYLLLQYWLTALFLWLVFFFLLRNWQKSALFSFALLCFHFFFGSMHDAAKSLIGSNFLTTYTFILPGTLITLSLIYFLIKRTKLQFTRLSKYFTLLLLILITIDSIQLAPKVSWTYKKAKVSSHTSLVTCDTCTKPDIHLIIADEYSGLESLSTLLDFDNTAFEKSLQSRGFHIVKNSRSNYNSSPFSVASSVNMNYLEGISRDDDNKDDLKLCYEKINRNSLSEFLKTAGYKIVNNSIFNFADIPTQARITLFPTKAGLISSQTFISRFLRDLLPSLALKFNHRGSFNNYIKTVLHNNERTIERLVTEVQRPAEQPRFVYTHLLMPHDPYYFDKDGRPFSLQNLLEGQEGKEKEYVSYLQYCNQRFLEIIDHILTRSVKPPIIIFMSDHGFRYYARPIDHKYEFMNINAIYLPNRRYEQFYHGMSNVNQFRALLNTAFGQHLPFLKDSTIIIN